MARRIDDIELLRLLRKNGRIGTRAARRIPGISEFSVRRRLAAVEDAHLVAVGTGMDFRQLAAYGAQPVVASPIVMKTGDTTTEQ